MPDPPATTPRTSLFTAHGQSLNESDGPEHLQQALWINGLKPVNAINAFHYDFKTFAEHFLFRKGVHLTSKAIEHELKVWILEPILGAYILKSVRAIYLLGVNDHRIVNPVLTRSL